MAAAAARAGARRPRRPSGRPDRGRHRDARPLLPGQRRRAVQRARHRRAASPSTSRPPAPASSMRSASPTASSAPARRAPCWWSAPRSFRASWTGRTAAPACCSATAPARCCCARERAPARLDRGILSTHLHSDGRFGDILLVDGGPASTGTAGKLRMAGNEVFRHAVSKLAAAASGRSRRSGLDASTMSLAGAPPGQPPHHRRGRASSACRRAGAWSRWTATPTPPPPRSRWRWPRPCGRPLERGRPRGDGGHRRRLHLGRGPGSAGSRAPDRQPADMAAERTVFGC